MKMRELLPDSKLVRIHKQAEFKVAQASFNAFKQHSYWKDWHYNPLPRISNVMIPYIETVIIC